MKGPVFEEAAERMKASATFRLLFLSAPNARWMRWLGPSNSRMIE